MKKNKNGFTLAELMVIIAIITILAFSGSGFIFNPQIDNQNAVLFLNDMYSNISNVKNNAILGKGVLHGGNLVYPNHRSIQISTNNSGSIKGMYSTGGALEKYNDFNVKFINAYSKINELKCWNIGKTSSQTGENVDIQITGNTLSFSGCTSPNNAILEIKLQQASFFKTIRINSVNGLIEKF